MAEAGGALRRVRAKLAACLERADFYEAHQLYRTLHFRLLAKKNYAELLELLHNGALELLKHGQQQSAVDVSILYVDVLTKSQTPVDKDIVQKLSDLFVGINSSVPERETFLTNAIRWSMGETTCGDPILHKNVAAAFWKEKNYQTAQQHYYYSEDGLSLAAMLIEMHTTQGTILDMDTYVATAVLQTLCKRKLRLSQDTFLYYVRLHPGIKSEGGPPFVTELLDFLWCLLEAVESKKVAAFKELLEKYDDSIRRDPSYPEYLHKIGKIWFNIIPPKTGMQNGLFGNLIQTLLNGMENDNASADDEPTPAMSQGRMQTEDVE